MATIPTQDEAAKCAESAAENAAPKEEETSATETTAETVTGTDRETAIATEESLSREEAEVSTATATGTETEVTETIEVMTVIKTAETEPEGLGWKRAKSQKNQGATAILGPGHQGRTKETSITAEMTNKFASIA